MFDVEPEFSLSPALMERARNHGRATAVVAGAGDELSLSSAFEAADAGLIEPILVGPRRTISALAERMGRAFGGLHIIDADTDAAIAAKSVEIARSGQAAVLMKGFVQTGALMKAVVDRNNGLRGERRITHAFYLTTPDSERGLVISDAAINVAPSVEVKTDIAVNAVALLHGLGVSRPRVAVLSGTEKASEKMPSSVEAGAVAGEVRTRLGERCHISGPLAMDLAISPRAARTKGVDDPVAGRADALVVPTLEAGNILYKALVYALGATAAGIVAGARVPIVLTSRADPLPARIMALAIAQQLTS